MAKLQKFIFGAVIIALLAPFHLAIYYGVVLHYRVTDSLYSGFLCWATDTGWSKGYSERKFAKITLGVTKDEVRRILGNPIWEPNHEYWAYTWSPSSTHYHQRGFVFSPSGNVTQIVKGFYFD